jgi:prevent-host-death family protein
MAKRMSASDAKNNFGGLLEDVGALGRVEILKHGRLVAVVLSPKALEQFVSARAVPRESSSWGETHMIPPESARGARVVSPGAGFDD